MQSFSDFEGQSVQLPRLHEDFAEGRYAHAYLITGPAGTGKKSCARLLAMTALCQGDAKPCGVCGPCIRVQSGNHPDFTEIVPEKGRRDILAGQMRETLAIVERQSFEGGAKVFFFPQADRINATAQNALLKTLEEPPENTIFLLVTDRPQALLPTVVSRCRPVRFHPLSLQATALRLQALGMDSEEARTRARISGGCVGAALDAGEEEMQLLQDVRREAFSVRSVTDAARVTARFREEKTRRAAILDILEGAARECVRVQGEGCPPEDMMLEGDMAAYAAKVPLAGGLRLMEAVYDAKEMLMRNVTFGSVLERVLLEIAEEYTRWPW